MKIVINDAPSVIRMRLENRERFLMRGVINECLIPDRVTIWVWEGAKSNDARRAVFPGYKQRPPAPTQTYAHLGLMKELISYTPAIQAWLDGFEGDDVIAALVEQYAGQAPIEIVSRDGDLAALCRPGVSIRPAKPPCSPEWVRLYKVCVGDTSDTIPGIKGFGKGAWEKASKEHLQVLIDTILLGGEWQDHHAERAGFSAASINWLRENEDEVRAMWRVINPLPMTPEQLSAAIRPGRDNTAAREALMGKYML